MIGSPKDIAIHSENMNHSLDKNIDPKALLVFEECEFETVLPIWKSELWPKRQSPIEPLSAIAPNLEIDMNIMQNNPLYVVCKENGKIAGVGSGHPTGNGSYRIRGIFVSPNFRNRGIASALLQLQIQNAKRLKMKFVWLLSRNGNDELYITNGFHITTRTDKYEFGPHSVMRIDV